MQDARRLEHGPAHGRGPSGHCSQQPKAGGGAVLRLISMNNPQFGSKVQAAFSTVPYPGDENIGAPDGRYDGEKVTNLFRGKDWRSLKLDDLWVPALSFMTPQAFHYYFPAFLLVALDALFLSDESDADLATSILASREMSAGDILERLTLLLASPEQDSYPEAIRTFYSRFGNFTTAQREVVREFIGLALEDQTQWDEELGGSVERSAVISLRKSKEYWDTF
jgi:hypothetical protein